MLKFHKDLCRNNQGFVLVAAMMILIVLTIIGIAAMSNTNLEKMIANNDRRHKEAFTAAEAGAALGVELVEQNIYCASGFTPEAGETYTDIEGVIRVYEQNSNQRAFYMNSPGFADNVTRADAVYPIDLTDTTRIRPYQFTSLYIGGATHMAPGGSLQMAAGYEGKGKSAAGGGAYKLFDIYSQHSGLNNSESCVVLGWRHPVDMTDTCKY